MSVIVIVSKRILPQLRDKRVHSFLCQGDPQFFCNTQQTEITQGTFWEVVIKNSFINIMSNWPLSGCRATTLVAAKRREVATLFQLAESSTMWVFLRFDDWSKDCSISRVLRFDHLKQFPSFKQPPIDGGPDLANTNTARVERTCEQRDPEDAGAEDASCQPWAVHQ